MKKLFLRRNLFPLKSFQSSLSSLSSSSSSSFPSDEAIILSSKLWIQNVVIKYTLCPWAAKDFQNTQIRVFKDNSLNSSSSSTSTSSTSSTSNSSSNSLFGINFKKKKSYNLLAYKDIQTNIFEFAKELALDLPNCHSGMAVIPQFTDFSEYLRFTDDFVELLQTTGLEEYIQIATFHPDYVFEDTEEDSAENWTSRSPYPAIHLLKVAEVAAAIDAYPGPTDKIWERNIRILRRLGAEEMERMRLETIQEGNKLTSTEKIEKIEKKLDNTENS